MSRPRPSGRSYGRLTRHERNVIERMLDRNRSAREIAAELGRSPSTVTREVAAHRYVTAPRSRYGEPAPEDLSGACPRLAAWPRCCNGCSHRRGYGCSRRPRVFYSARRAQEAADAELSSSRSGIDETEEGAAAKLAAIRGGLARGLSPQQIAATTPGLSASTVYRWVDAGYDGMTNMELRRKVGYRPRSHRAPKRATSHSARRSHAAFLALGEDACAAAWEMDTVEDAGCDSARLLTLLHRPSRFQLALPLPDGACASVLAALSSLRAVLGEDGARRAFGAVLTDNGSEFADEDAIAALLGERDGETRLFYCDPRQSQQKGACEKNHVEIRKLLWIGYTDVDSSGRGAGDGRAVYEGPQAPEAFHRRVQEADSRPLQRRQAQARDHGRVRPRQEHRGEVDQVDKRDRLAARRGQPHARAEPDPGARAREPQAPDGGRRLKTSGADIRSKVRAIAANEGRYPISAQCRLLGVARSTYYSMRSRADRPAAPDPAAPAVVAAHAASKGRYGSRKIKASLERSGVTVSRRRVCRIMRENGLVSAYGRKRFKVHPGAVNEADVPNVVARGFGGRAPRTHICSDLTYVRVGASWNYVCLLVDLYNREIVGHSAGPRKDARLVKSAFATLSFPISDIEVFHTDRGSEFDNAEIDLMLEAFGIERSLSAKGCPYDNAVDESTNRILKAELVHRETFGTTRELRAKLSDYVHWYNNFRIHSTLGYMSPVEFWEAGLSLPESSK